MIDYPEGATPLDPNELDSLKFKHITTRGELDHLEQANIESGLQWLAKSKTSDILNEAFVRELHRRLFGDVWKWAGTFRTTEKNIGVDPRQISVQLRLLLDDMRYWIDDKTCSPKESAVRFHHRLASLHPFPNGNGRHARIMADAVLVKIFKEPPINWSAGYDLQSMGERRVQYIAALRAADQGDYGPLLAFAGIENHPFTPRT
jgi:Fic-DOC domain mobile mystery protein B